MKTLLLFFSVLLVSGAFAQKQPIGFLSEPDTSETIWLDYFRIVGESNPNADTLIYVTDSSAFEYLYLDDFTHVTQWYHFRDGTTVKLVLQQDGSWIYVQKRGEEVLSYGKCRGELTTEIGYVNDSYGEDSVVLAWRLAREGTWYQYYKNGWLTGKYEHGNKVGEWQEYRDFSLGSTSIRILYATHVYNQSGHSSKIYTSTTSEERTQLIHSANWGISAPQPDDFSVFSIYAYAAYLLKSDGTIEQQPRCGAPQAKSWTYNEKSELLSIGSQRYKVVFVSPETLILEILH